MVKGLNFYYLSIKSLILLFFPCLCFSQNNFTAAAIKTDVLAQKFLKKHDLPGFAVSISYNDTTIYSKGFGFANIENQLPVMPSQSQFRIGSITKTLTAVALAKLAHEHKIDLDKSIYYYLDSLPKKQYDFTLRQIGGHTAGLERIYMPYNNDSLLKVSNKDLYKSFTKPLIFKPGTQFKYSNFGYELLGMVIEKASGMPYSAAVQKLVLEPLKMDGTGDILNAESNTKYYSNIKSGKKIKALYMGHNVNTASGFYYATAEDLIKLGNALLFAGKVLNKESLLELIKPQKLTSGKGTGYGIGVEALADIDGKWSYGHSGRIYGGTSFFGVSPSSKLVIVILVNCDYLKAGAINELAKDVCSQYFKAIDKE